MPVGLTFPDTFYIKNKTLWYVSPILIYRYLLPLTYNSLHTNKDGVVGTELENLVRNLHGYSGGYIPQGKGRVLVPLRERL